MLATIRPEALIAMIVIGILWAIIRDLRTLARARRDELDARRRVHAELAKRGYHVTKDVSRYGSLIVDDPWNHLQAQLEHDMELYPEAPVTVRRRGA